MFLPKLKAASKNLTLFVSLPTFYLWKKSYIIDNAITLSFIIHLDGLMKSEISPYIDETLTKRIFIFFKIGKFVFVSIKDMLAPSKT